MSLEPDYTQWQQILDLLAGCEKSQQQMLLSMLLTFDEREALLARANIFHQLLQGELSQRQISQMLGVGIATITRGSHELKSMSDVDKQQLAELLNPPKRP